MPADFVHEKEKLFKTVGIFVGTLKYARAQFSKGIHMLRWERCTQSFYTKTWRKLCISE